MQLSRFGDHMHHGDLVGTDRAVRARGTCTVIVLFGYLQQLMHRCELTYNKYFLDPES